LRSPTWPSAEVFDSRSENALCRSEVPGLEDAGESALVKLPDRERPPEEAKDVGLSMRNHVKLWKCTYERENHAW
jgi:spore coat polysaccharide biosynthesis protein SpsF (cytidylyltransferase family)